MYGLYCGWIVNDNKIINQTTRETLTFENHDAAIAHIDGE